MPVANMEFDVELPSHHTPVEAIDAPKNSTFTAHVPRQGLDGLMKYVEGHPWTVRYYGQLLAGQTALNHFDPLKGNLAQSYVEVKDLVLRVSSTLSYSYDDMTGLGDISGSAHCPYKISPMTGDVFIATVETGEDVLFVVNKVDRATHRTNTIYNISYNSFAYKNSHPQYLIDLQKRVQSTYVYDNRLDNGSKHILITEDSKAAIDDLLDFMHDSKSYFFDSFIQQRFNAIGVPGLTHNVIDNIMGVFLTKTVDITRHISNNRFDYAVWNRDIKQQNILDCLIMRRLPSKSLNANRIGFTSSVTDWRRGRLASMQFSGIDYFTRPLEPNRNHQSNTMTPPIGGLLDVRTENNYFDQDQFLIETVDESGHKTKRLLHDLFEDDYYIVSKNFYDYIEDNSKYADISYMELIIYKHLKGEVLDPRVLIAIASTWDRWSTLYQFYMLPVLWVIIKTQLGII